ncbi:MAG: roadblock/LC7 domain-containing protein [Armatimonadota bacterium]|nr:roadblock/LC7 domain-containing protein [Armatimonadota bacterium]MDR7451416.1 roadblock/LC7 domain-containing protein [Armatimonadota bacterium]MDR7466434.1 roadblock/LC7 domain-containing protein [Armatimonadota bacterium]MDR7493156.1 roadblock/LC7 domain-containing protein [Armatimonadota bacterium]MDR7500345.1 roadblock/LC7 domain-containing protein [Armatimonadota bacterium]
MPRLAAILKGLKEQSGAAAALISSADGLLLEAVDDAGVDLESLAAYAASSVMVSERLGEMTAFGGPEAVVILYRGRPLVITPMGPIVVALVGTAQTPAGALRMHLRHATVDLVSAVQDELQAPPAPRSAAGPAAAAS